MDDDSARGASTLPGWTREHVAAHFSGVAYALAQQRPAAWLAGRSPQGPVKVPGGEVPGLRPWP